MKDKPIIANHDLDRLQQNGIVSDEAIWPDDIALADRDRALKWLEDNKEEL